MARWCGGPGRKLISGSRRHNVVSVFPADRSYLSATFTQQSPGFAIVASKVHRRGVKYSAVCGIWLFVCVNGATPPRRGATRVSGEAPSRPADGELSRRGSSCLPAVRRHAHCWLACACHIPEVEPEFLLAVSTSRCLHPVQSACERRAVTAPLLTQTRSR